MAGLPSRDLQIKPSRSGICLLGLLSRLSKTLVKCGAYLGDHTLLGRMPQALLYLGVRTATCVGGELQVLLDLRSVRDFVGRRGLMHIE